MATAVHRIDDPVRMYLTQMGMIPLLTRDEEIRLAKKIETTRMIFRRRCLECDYIASEAVEDPPRRSTGDTAVRPDDADLHGRGEPQGEDRPSGSPSNLGTIEPLLDRNARRTGRARIEADRPASKASGRGDPGADRAPAPAPCARCSRSCACGRAGSSR
jgi:hypothetical protein